MTKLVQSKDSICLIYMFWWSIPIIITCFTLILSIFCLNQCPNEDFLPYFLLGQSCFTLILISWICYLRHGNDHWLINSFSIFFFLIYFISFVLTSLLTFRRIKDVTSVSPFIKWNERNPHSLNDCLSYCYPIGLCFFLVQLFVIICPLPVACIILIFVMKNSSGSIDSLMNRQETTHV